MPAIQQRPDRIPEPQPQNARQTVALVRDDHRWKDAPLDLNSTDGIKRNIEALWATINGLAAYVDGDRPSERPSDVQPSPYQTPDRKSELERTTEPVKTVHQSTPMHPAPLP